MVASEDLMRLLSRFARTLTGPYEVSDVLDVLATEAQRCLNAAGAGVSLADREGNLRFATASSDSVVRLERAQEDSQSGPCFEAYDGGHEVLVADMAEEGRWTPYRWVCLEAGMHSVAGIPMRWNSTTLGALNIYREQAGAWSESDITLARVMADMATGYIAHSSRFDEA